MVIVVKYLHQMRQRYFRMTEQWLLIPHFPPETFLHLYINGEVSCKMILIFFPHIRLRTILYFQEIINEIKFIIAIVIIVTEYIYIPYL